MEDASQITVSEIISRCATPEVRDGAKRIALESNQAAGPEKPVSKWAVYKWRQNGIPERNWPLIKRLTGVTTEELHAANMALLGVQAAAE